MNKSWLDKVSNTAQIGGIETSIIDNGPARGNRIAWINTGSGLRLKVNIDRAMDIGEAFFNEHSLAWLSHTGIPTPQPFSDKGVDWLRTFGGGLLTTCGLTHVGGPESDSFGERGLHGLISNQVAQVESVIQPNPFDDRLDMSITGIIKETKIFGPSLELRRTISCTLGKAVIRIHDEVINRANTPAPLMILYHMNFGWPLVDEGAVIVWRGEWRPRHPDRPHTIFKKGNDFRTCPAPLDEHLGTGEEVGIIDVAPDSSGICGCGIHNSRLGIALALRFHKNQLPWLTNWQHWGKGEYVTGLEPGTNPPIGQAKAREEGTLIMLAPGERRNYDLELEILSDRNKIDLFLLSNDQD
jgi:Domain of unknown function (DUF4432)